MGALDENEATIGFNKKLEWSDTENGSYTRVSNTVDVDLPDRSLGEAEFTNDESPDFHRQFTPQLYDPGTLDFTYIYTDDAFEAIEELYATGMVAETRDEMTKWWKITIPTGAVCKFRGYVNKHGMPMTVDGINQVAASLRVSGKMTFTPAGGS
jgi:hypothetical protein